MSVVRVVITVGLSILENAQRECLDQTLDELVKAGKPFTEDDRQKIQTLIKGHLTANSDVKGEITRLLETRPEQSSAEIGSYLKLERRGLLSGHAVDVVLVATAGGEDEPGSEWIATTIAPRFQNRGATVETRTFRGGVATGPAYRRALVSLVGVMHDVLSQGTYDHTYVIITGGYKGFVPWVTLLTQLHERTSFVYAHEHSTEVLVAPSLFVTWDLTRVDEMRTILRREVLSAAEHEILPPPYQLLYDPDATAGNYRRNALGAVVDEHTKTPFWRLGRGRPLLERLRRRDEALHKDLESRLPDWAHLWLGNQVPETVEHEQLHSVRLMEYTDWLLSYYPSLEEALGPRGLYYLIASLWLHDIGHGALLYKGQPIFLMPSLVREYHNLTSAHMIRIGGFLPGDAAGPVALVSEFNRQHLSLVPGNGRADATLAGRASAEFSSEQGVIVLVGALLGLLDSVDVQMDRVVSESYRRMRDRRTSEEIRAALAELEALSPSCSLLGSLESLLQDYGNRNYGSEAFQNKCKAIRQATEEGFEAAWTRRDAARLHQVSLANRVVFKLIQRLHFDKHSAIGLVYLTKGERELEVNLRPGEDAELFDREVDVVAKDICDEARRALEVATLKRQVSGVAVHAVRPVAGGTERRELLARTES